MGHLQQKFKGTRLKNLPSAQPPSLPDGVLKVTKIGKCMQCMQHQLQHLVMLHVVYRAWAGKGHMTLMVGAGMGTIMSSPQEFIHALLVRHRSFDCDLMAIG